MRQGPELIPAVFEPSVLPAGDGGMDSLDGVGGVMNSHGRTIRLPSRFKN